ncbi:MAG: NADH oxidase [Spirochaeta sp.]|nr:NADH oxidase [Spirochaeta sp.]
MSESCLQIQSLIKEEGVLELSLAELEMPTPKAEQVVVRVEAAPINPSDLGLLFGPADMTTAKASGTAEAPIITAEIPAGLMPGAAARVGQPMPVGNEGAGVVVAAGDSEAAQGLLGKTVSAVGGAMYSQFRKLHVSQCLVLEDGTTPEEGASCFVNPLTALGMVETMRREGHSALVHTAAASNLGQMLNKLCQADGVPLVNVVRKTEQEELLRGIGAQYVVNSSSPDFLDQLTSALSETGATLAFDATGGGELASQILTAMERALMAGGGFSGYGSSTHKQVYVYGGLDRSPTVLNRAYGMAWGIGGWLLTPFMEKVGMEEVVRLQQRVAREVKTTFASSYSQTVSLAEALTLDAIHTYRLHSTGTKFLIDPSRG